MQFSIWVSFYEIYNEFLYDLLDASPSLQPRKRVTLRLSDDKHGNPYVKGYSQEQLYTGSVNALLETNIKHIVFLLCLVLRQI